MTKKHPGMALLRCTNLTCGRLYYSYDRTPTWCSACRKDPALKHARQQLFAAERVPRPRMTDDEHAELLKQVPF